MKRVYHHQDRALVNYVLQTLQHEGVSCLLRNEFLLGAAGELPPTECVPEVWVRDDDDVSRAKRIIDDVLQQAPNAPEWLCSSCGEMVEGVFAECWQCGAVKKA